MNQISYLKKDNKIIAQFVVLLSESAAVLECKVVTAGEDKCEAQVNMHRILQDLAHDKIFTAIEELREEIG